MSRRPTILAEKKLRIVLSVLEGEISIAEAARPEKESEQAIGNWKRQFLEGGRPGSRPAIRPDTGDRRRNVLELTENGHAVLAHAVHASDQAERQFLSQLDDEESAQLRMLLTRVTQEH